MPEVPSVSRGILNVHVLELYLFTSIFVLYLSIMYIVLSDAIFTKVYGTYVNNKVLFHSIIYFHHEISEVFQQATK